MKTKFNENYINKSPDNNGFNKKFINFLNHMKDNNTSSVKAAKPNKVLHISGGCCTEFNIYYFILYLF